MYLFIYLFSSAPFLLATSKPPHPFEAQLVCLRRIIAETSWVARASYTPMKALVDSILCYILRVL